MDLDFLSAFPALPKGATRTIFVRGLQQDIAQKLGERGYVVVELMTLPRTNPLEHQQYLLSKSQACEEGTIEFTTEERRALELEMKAHGLLDSKKTQLNVNVDIDTNDLQKMLNWTDSRHTLADNSTVQAAKTFKELKENN